MGEVSSLGITPTPNDRVLPSVALVSSHALLVTVSEVSVGAEAAAPAVGSASRAQDRLLARGLGTSAAHAGLERLTGPAFGWPRER